MASASGTPLPKRHAALVLEDGRSFVGGALGADRLGEGEVVFNTAMTGYQEVLTDPSYAGQMLCMTYPLQGNYGLREADGESSRTWARAFIVRWACERPSSHSSQWSLDGYLRDQGIPGIAGIDTRALTRHLRTHGTLRAVVSHEAERPTRARLEELHQAALRVRPLADQDLVGETSTREIKEWLEPLPPELARRAPADGSGLTVAVVDYGVKRGILRSLRSRGCRVVVLPHTAGWDDLAATGADGLVLTNGPGDPEVLVAPVELCRRALEAGIPLLGICLGHQILGRAIGGRTSRLGFGHHGANHPVRDTLTGAIHITSQNHEFQVDADSIPAESGFFVSRVNVHDGSVEGLAHPDQPAFSVQYHPEGCPGPTDNQGVFDHLVDLMRGRRPAPPAPFEPAAKPRRVLIIGSGPIVIGQAAEFDYAGTQACTSLREEGIETILVNSNPATIMTDENVADRTYIEPLTVEFAGADHRARATGRGAAHAGRADRAQPGHGAARSRASWRDTTSASWAPTPMSSATPRTARRSSSCCSGSASRSRPPASATRWTTPAPSLLRSVCRWWCAPLTRWVVPAAASSPSSRSSSGPSRAGSTRRPSTRCWWSARCGAGRSSSTR